MPRKDSATAKFVPADLKYVTPFLRYDNEKQEDRMLIFASDLGLQTLAKCIIVHGDGKFEFAFDFSSLHELVS